MKATNNILNCGLKFVSDFIELKLDLLTFRSECFVNDQMKVLTELYSAGPSSCYIFVFIANLCDGQDYKPFYQSNSSQDFSRFLSGVKYAYVVLGDKDAKYIVDNPSSGNAFAISGLLSYLESIGFEDVKWGTAAKTPQHFASLCDQVVVSTSWGYQDNTFTDITMSFKTCRGDMFSFKASKDIRLSDNTNISTTFHNTYMKMYGYKKGSYSTYNRLSLSSEMTQWTEEALKEHFKENGADPIEGIYESVTGTAFMPKYKLGLIKTETGYNLIYFSGAVNYIDWQEGELKAELSPTATPTLFKAEWRMGNKKTNDNPYITFEQGMMNLVFPDNDITLYIKLFPTSSDDVSSAIGGPASGSGFALSSDGFIVTNHHVVNGAKSIKIRGINGDFSRAYNAKIVIEDKNNDLAIIRIDEPDFKTLGVIPYIISGKNSDVGTSIFVLGYPLRATMGDEIKLTDGIVSSKSGFQGDVTSYQISAPVQPGNSGGPLFDSKGNLIGIINAKHTGAENASYAVKATYLLNLFELMNSAPKTQTVSTVSGKPLIEQVKILKKFTYIIEVE
jgi:Trypsin-like peptidase domain